YLRHNMNITNISMAFANQLRSFKGSLDTERITSLLSPIKDSITTITWDEYLAIILSQGSHDESAQASNENEIAITVPITWMFPPTASLVELAIRLRKSGNAAFEQKKFALALEHYTGSICNSPSDEVGMVVAVNSENNEDGYGNSNLALTYGNRSAAFYHLGLYEAVVVDIGLALAAGYQDTSGKLNRRKLKAETALKKAEKEFSDNLTKQQQLLSALSLTAEEKEGEKKGSREQLIKSTLNFEPSPVCSTLSAKVQKVHKVKSTDTGDCSLVAREPIPLGAVLAIEQPYCSVLLENKEKKYCHHCCRRLMDNCSAPADCSSRPENGRQMYILPAVPCPSCTNVLFCSTACQREACSSYHQTECALLPLLHTLEISQHVVFRMLATSGSSFDTSVAKTLVEAELANKTTVASTSAKAATTLSSVEQRLVDSYSAALQMKHQQSWNFSTENVFCSLTAGLLVDLATRSGWLKAKTEKTKEDLQTSSSSSSSAIYNQKDNHHQLVGALCRRHLMQMPGNCRTVFAPSSAAVNEVGQAAKLKQIKSGSKAETDQQNRPFSSFPPEFAEFSSECAEFDLLPVATAIYPVTSSTIRHSCAANAVATFHYGRLLVVRASREIAAGEEVTLGINSSDVHYSKLEVGERLTRLKEDYAVLFCTCTACQYELANGLDKKRYLPLAHSDTCRGLVEVRPPSTCGHKSSKSNKSKGTNQYYCRACNEAVPEAVVRQKYEHFDRLCQQVDAKSEPLKSLIKNQRAAFSNTMQHLKVEDCSLKNAEADHFVLPPSYHTELADYAKLAEELQTLLVPAIKSTTTTSTTTTTITKDEGGAQSLSAVSVETLQLVFACKAQQKLISVYGNLALGFYSIPYAASSSEYADCCMTLVEGAFAGQMYCVESLFRLLQHIQVLEVGTRMFSIAALGRKQSQKRGAGETAEMSEEDKASFCRWMTRLERFEKLLSTFSLNKLTIQSPAAIESPEAEEGTVCLEQKSGRVGPSCLASSAALPADDGSGFLAFERHRILELKMALLMAKKAV
ncbi:SET and MYND domain-containing protein 4, partial [Tyrophagus putrescentiae]